MKVLSKKSLHSVTGGSLFDSMNSFFSDKDKFIQSFEDKFRNPSKDTLESIGGNIGRSAGGTVGGSIGGIVGGVAGDKFGRFLGGIAYDHPEDFRHPDFGKVWDPFDKQSN